MQKILQIIEAVGLYDRYRQEENKESMWRSKDVADAWQDLKLASIATGVDIGVLAKLSHMEKCYYHAQFKTAAHLSAEEYQDTLARLYPTLMDWYADYLVANNDAVMARKFRDLRAEVTRSVAA